MTDVWPDSFLAAGRLWWLLAVLALAGAYVVLSLVRRRYTVRFTNLALLDQVAPRRPGWRRHLAAGAFLLAVAASMVAWARPADEVLVPKERATVVLAIDTSLSMEATDVAPSRLEAAQQAALAFVDELPEPINLGFVSFDGVARVRVTPTTDRDPVRRAIETLELGPATAIGEAIFAGLDAIRTAPVPEDEDGEIQPVPVDEEPLRLISDRTGGQFFSAQSLDQLNAVYEDIGSSVGFDTEEQEVTDRFVGFAVVLLLVSGAASLLWSQRLP